MAETLNFQSPVGRMVSGSFNELQTKDHQGKDQPAEKHKYFVGIAFRKTAANWWDEPGELGAMFRNWLTAAQSHYRNGEWQQPGFAWKINNGDDPKHAGKAGYAGHWVVSFTRSASIGEIPLIEQGNPPRYMLDRKAAKRGYYYAISGGVVANGCTGNQAGVYVNINAAMLVGYGEEIISGPSPEQLFSNPVVLPPGASATPVATAAMAPALPGGYPAPQAAPGGYPAPRAAPGGYPAPAGLQPAVPGMVPAPDFLNPQIPR